METPFRGSQDSGSMIYTPGLRSTGVHRMYVAGRAGRFRIGLVVMPVWYDRMWRPVDSGSDGRFRRFAAVDRSRRPQADAGRKITEP